MKKVAKKKARKTARKKKTETKPFRPIPSAFSLADDQVEEFLLRPDDRSVKGDAGESYRDLLIDYFGDLDLVITEGYKGARKPKIEVVRAARHDDALLRKDDHLVAVVTDADLKIEQPVFGLEDIDNLANFIEEKYLK